MTEVESAKLITAMITAYPDDWRFLDEVQQEATRKMYRHMMRDLDAKACSAACARLIATHRKMPRISEIREATFVQLNGRSVVGGEAWGRVTSAIAKYGRNKRPGQAFVFVNPITALAVESMGWEYLCGITDERAVADRARFIELYDHLAERAIEDANVGAIAAPIPRSGLPAGPTHIGDILQRLLPAKES